MPGNPQVKICGIRHHGPGSARSLVAALNEFAPDCLLIEGPADAGDVLPLALAPGMEPPVAIIGYEPDKPQNALYYPFAVFSPEWQAILYGLGKGIRIALIDLPFSILLGMEAEKRAGDERWPIPDPISWLASAAGHEDPERWWELMVEERKDGADVFQAVMEAMTALRNELAHEPDDMEATREAHMRQALRAALKEGFERVAVVCGAWHGPALTPESMSKPKDDAARLKGLLRHKANVTWIPWTYGHLDAHTGYGAGVLAPGWYHHLFENPKNATVTWLTGAARLLRSEDLSASSAQIIDAVRLSETLASMRGRPLPGLREMNDAALAVFCMGSGLPLKLVEKRLVIGERLGRVPDGTPLVPLDRDFRRELTRLRLKLSPAPEDLELDLRKPKDLDVSRLLHRLLILGVPWGTRKNVRGKGTFKENWELRWTPELSLGLIAANAHGNTLVEASAACSVKQAASENTLAGLTGLLELVIPADLPQAAEQVMATLKDRAALTGDVEALIDALAPLVKISRYGDVRSSDREAARAIARAMAARICVGLPLACGSIGDDTSQDMYGRIAAFTEALVLLDDESLLGDFREVLRRFADSSILHGLIGGQASRLLLDAASISPEEAADKMSLALSLAMEPEHSASWFEGFLKGSGLLLVHDDNLWNLADQWISGLGGEYFERVLPLVRRTFSDFNPAERRKMGERLKSESSRKSDGISFTEAGEELIHRERAEKVLPVIGVLLGIKAEEL